MIDLFKVWSNKDEALRLMGDCMTRGYTGQGPMVDRFEEELAQVLGVAPWQVVTVNSGTSAIQLSLALCGITAIEPHKPVGVSAQTCMAGAHAVQAQGGDLYWLEVDRLTGLTTDESIKPWMQAIVVTDLGGLVPNHFALRRAMGTRYIIQDAAQNFTGTMYGDYVALSFQSIKHLATGDGGAVIVRTSKDDADKARLMRWFGLDRKSSADFRSQQNITLQGYKFHMSDLDASLGIANLPGAVAHVKASRENARWYQANLPSGVLVPWQEEGTYWTYMILVERRAEFMAYMAEKGIHTSPVQSIGTKHDLFPHDRLPGAEWYGARNVAIPSGWWVTDEERAYIADCVVAFEG